MSWALLTFPEPGSLIMSTVPTPHTATTVSSKTWATAQQSRLKCPWAETPRKDAPYLLNADGTQMPKSRDTTLVAEEAPTAKRTGMLQVLLAKPRRLALPLAGRRPIATDKMVRLERLVRTGPVHSTTTTVVNNPLAVTMDHLHCLRARRRSAATTTARRHTRPRLGLLAPSRLPRRGTNPLLGKTPTTSLLMGKVEVHHSRRRRLPNPHRTGISKDRRSMGKLEVYPHRRQMRSPSMLTNVSRLRLHRARSPSTLTSDRDRLSSR